MEQSAAIDQIEAIDCIYQWCEQAELPIDMIEQVVEPLPAEGPDTLVISAQRHFLRLRFKRPITPTERQLLRVLVRDYETVRNSQLALYELAHEVGNPLAVLDGQLRFIRDGDASLDRWNSAFRAIAQIAKRLHEVTASDAPPVYAFNVMDVVGQVLDDLSLESRQKGVIWEVPSQELFLVWYRHRLQQILFNLMKNAVEAAESGGTVRVSITHRGNMTTISVYNIGHRRDPEIIDSLFIPHHSSKGDGHLGMGLSLSRRLAEKSGARLEYDQQGGFSLEIRAPEYGLQAGNKGAGFRPPGCSVE